MSMRNKALHIKIPISDEFADRLDAMSNEGRDLFLYECSYFILELFPKIARKVEESFHDARVEG